MTSICAVVHLSLKDAILSIACRPGEILRKGDICKRLGVSRSLVSEAVVRLAAEGLVDIVPQAGTFVAHFSMAEIREGAFLREAIELAAIEQVARTITGTQLTKLRRNLRVQEALVADADEAGFCAMDGAFHEMLLSFTSHRKLAQVSQTAWLRINRVRQLVLPVPGRIEATLDEHHAILAALEAHDPEGARNATRVHLRKLICHLEPLERERLDLFNPA